MKLRLPAALLAIILLTGCPAKPGKSSGPPSMPPVPVQVGVAVKKDMPLDLRTFGNVEPIASVAIKAQVGGELIGVSFEEGQDVKKGDLLFTIQPRLYDTQRAQAAANLARDRAQALNARQELARQEELDRKQVGTKGDIDKARAQADALDATVRADEALLLIAETQLGYTTVESPIDGRTGAIRMRPGNLIKVGDDAPLTTVVQLAPIYVTFALPEQHLTDIRKGMETRKLPVSVFNPRTAAPLADGTLTFIANTVDAETGTVLLKATFTNEDHTLWPGTFVDVILHLDVQHDVVVVPSPAVTAGQKGTQVFVVKEDGTAELRPVTVVRTLGQESIISDGVQPGEKVVINGQSRLLPGGKVLVKTDSAPAIAAPAAPAKP